MKQAIGIVAIGCVALFFVLVPRSHSADPFRFSPPQGWAAGPSYPYAKTWKGDPAKRQFLSIIEDSTLKPPLEGPAPSDAELIDIFQKSAAMGDDMAGVTQYKIEKLEREKLPSGGLRIALLGTFKDATGALVHFEEWKFFLSAGYSQIQYSETGTSSINRADVAHLLGRYQPFGS